MKFLAAQTIALLLCQNHPIFGFHLPFAVRNINSHLSMSVPNALDTLTSGLASIVRVDEKGLAGVTVSGNTKAGLDDIELKLFDIENDSSCRIVREAVTELDLVIDKIVPAAPKSRAVIDKSFQDSLPEGQQVPCLVASLGDGQTKIISGQENIVEFLTDTFSAENQVIKEIGGEEEPLKQVVQTLAPALLFVAGALRVGRGKNVSPAVTASTEVNRPETPLILYSYEGNQFCRLVREVLTELDIVYELRSAGKGSPRRNELAELTGGSTQCPYLVDPNTKTNMSESADIIRYLYQTYALWAPPNELLEWTSQNVMSLFKPIFSFLAPLQAGSSDEVLDASNLQAAKQEIEAEISSNPVVIYTYDLSPFSSETKALLSNLRIDYKDIPLGKEWLPGLLDQKGAIKRAALLEMTGQSSLPHVFVDGKPCGGLFSGTPGIVPLLEQNKFVQMCQDAAAATTTTTRNA